MEEQNGQNTVNPALLKVESLQRYIETHPGERFWQALRNWSGAEAIYRQVPAGKGGWRVIYEDMPIYIVDTFNDD